MYRSIQVRTSKCYDCDRVARFNVVVTNAQLFGRQVVECIVRTEKIENLTKGFSLKYILTALHQNQ